MGASSIGGGGRIYGNTLQTTQEPTVTVNVGTTGTVNVYDSNLMTSLGVPPNLMPQQLNVGLSQTQSQYISTLSGAELQSLGQIAGVAVDSVYNNSGAANPVLQSRWSNFIADVSTRSGEQIDVGALVQWVLREAYVATSQDLQFYAEKTKFYNDMKKAVRTEMTSVMQQLSDPAIAKLGDNDPLPAPVPKSDFSDVWAPGLSATATPQDSSVSVSKVARPTQTQSGDPIDTLTLSDAQLAGPSGISGKKLSDCIDKSKLPKIVFKEAINADQAKTVFSQIGTLLGLQIPTNGLDTIQKALSKASMGDMSKLEFTVNNLGTIMAVDPTAVDGLKMMVFAKDGTGGYNGTFMHGDPHVDEFHIDTTQKGDKAIESFGDDWHYTDASKFTLGGFSIYTQTQQRGTDVNKRVATRAQVFCGAPDSKGPDVQFAAAKSTNLKIDGGGTGMAPAPTDLTEAGLSTFLDPTGTKGGDFALAPNGEWAIYKNNNYYDVQPVNFGQYDAYGNIQVGSAIASAGGDAYCTTKKQLTDYKDVLEQKLNTLGDDAQLAQMDLQNILQRQQQLIQMMSTISKQLNDNAMAIIRKIG
jgi:hypothetical protein